MAFMTPTATMLNNRTGDMTALLPELRKLFEEQHANMTLSLENENTHTAYFFMSLVFIISILVVTRLPFESCKVHKHYAGSGCTCAKPEGSGPEASSETVGSV